MDVLFVSLPVSSQWNVITLSVAQPPASLNLPGFVGCLELATLNNDVISLYNFKNIYNMDPSKSVPCAR